MWSVEAFYIWSPVTVYGALIIRVFYKVKKTNQLVPKYNSDINVHLQLGQ